MDDPNSEIRLAAIKGLSAIGFRLKNKQVHALAEKLKEKLDDEHESVRLAAMQCLKVISPQLSKEALNSFALFIETKINDNSKSSYINFIAIEILNALTAKLDTRTLSILIERLKLKTNSSAPSIRSVAMEYLSGVTLHLSDEILDVLVVQEKLNDPSWDVLEAATKLLAFKPKGKENTLNEHAKQLITELDGNSLYCYRRITLLTNISPQLFKTTLNYFVKQLISKLVIEDYGDEVRSFLPASAIRISAISSLVRIAPYLSENTLVELIDEVKNNFKNHFASGHPELKIMTHLLIRLSACLKEKGLPVIDYMLNILLDEQYQHKRQFIYDFFNFLISEKEAREGYFQLLEKYNSNDCIELQFINYFIASIKAENSETLELEHNTYSLNM